jgi:diguanylate cyclase (GGDEF)-like protein
MAKDRTDEHNRALALMDELTGLYNRRHTQQTLVRQLAQARRAQRPLAVLMLDVDHFKRVNDTYGHPTGDQVLRELALRILERLRAQDLAGRWGGEEFLVVLPDTDARGAQALAGQLILAIEGRPFLAANGKPLRLTASVGVHVLPAGEAGERYDMISAADRALYLAKERGRNRVEVL